MIFGHEDHHEQHVAKPRPASKWMVWCAAACFAFVAVCVVQSIWRQW